MSRERHQTLGTKLGMIPVASLFMLVVPFLIVGCRESRVLSALQDRIAQTDRIEIVSIGGAADPIVVEQREAIERLRQIITADTASSIPMCKCIGHTEIRLFRNGARTENINWAHIDQIKLKADGEWKAFRLSDSSSVALQAWLDSVGYHLPGGRESQTAGH